jgi:hypothetical protein
MALGVEGSSSDTFTGDSDTTNGSWVLLTATGAGSTTSGAAIRGQYKLVTATGTQNWGPTFTARDRAAIGLVFAVGIPPVTKTASDTLSITATEGTTSKEVITVLAEENFEDDTFNITKVSGNWIRTSSQFNTGSWSYTNADIGDGQTSDVVFQIPAGSTTMTVWVRTSTESGWDFLRILLDGAQSVQYSGTTPWTLVTLNVTDKSEVTFRYFKDTSSSAGEDSVYIDDITFTGVPPVEPDLFTASDTLNLTVSSETSAVLVAAEQSLAPDAILTQTNITGALSDINESPDASDGVWMDGSGAIVLRVSFPTPTTNLVSGFSQRFRIRVRPGE